MAYTYYHQDYLPDLTTLSENSFDNILCSAVLMHLNKNDVEKACLRLLALLKTNGVLIITLRGTHQSDKRENGKLYEEIDIKELCQFFEQHHSTILTLRGVSSFGHTPFLLANMYLF
ncbi:MAG: class I SAM-dependent methyltransferase [Pseudomonadales bacterium]|nr:class I SAM-dependent methyltransferase [Pseudomonadales bacterium]